MTIGKVLPLAGVLGVSALSLLGLGALGGCSAGDGDHSSHEGHKAGDGHKMEDSHKGNEQGQEPAASTTPTATAELKSITPSASYPLKTCVVSGDPLTEMGGPVAFEYEGTEVQFCCDGCIKEFKKDPAAYMAKVRAAKK